MTSRRDFKDTWPFTAIILVVTLVGSISALRTVASLSEPGRLVIFVSLLVIVASLFLAAPSAMARPRRRLAVLIAISGGIFGIGLLTPDHWLVMGLFPGLAGLAVGAFWPAMGKSVAAAILCFVLLATNLAVANGGAVLLDWLPFAGLALLFAFVYVALYVRQVQARNETETLLQDLERAHAQLQESSRQLEQLTLTQERERMGRELHDTLAQGLAGLIMQLEAAEHHLERGATDRARDVVRQAMRRARSTHHEARRAIQALRASVLERQSLVEALDREAEQLTADTGLPCRFDVEGPLPELSPDQTQHLLRIAQEGLTNAVRHAEATRVELLMEGSGEGLRLVIEDDGKGFEPSEATSGFGLAGMRERAARIGGELRVVQRRPGGIRIELALEPSLERAAT